jgi:hypothetical protein
MSSVRRLACAAACASALLTAALVAAQPAALVVNVPVADMFSKPTTEADVVSQAIYGSLVSVVPEPEVPADWVKVRTSDDYVGWVRRPELAAEPAAQGGATVRVDSLAAHVYIEPDVTSHRPMLTVPYESRLNLVAAAEGADAARWRRVRLVDGRLGWIQAGDIAEEDGTLDVEASIALARRFIGVTYTWGGRSSFGFDCSGFTQMLMRRRGIHMPRDAQPQADWTGLVAVEREALQPGDLLFFGRNATRITHTGYYIGGGQFIHDTTSGRPGVQISSLDEERWKSLLVAQRRARPAGTGS